MTCWQDIEEYRVQTDRNRRHQLLLAIRTRYLDYNAVDGVNITAAQREIVLASVDAALNGALPADQEVTILDDIQHQMVSMIQVGVHLMHCIDGSIQNDTLPRFTKTVEYRKLVGVDAPLVL